MQVALAVLLVLGVTGVGAEEVARAAGGSAMGASSAASEPSSKTVWNLGTGLEARLQRDVNPDYAEPAALGQLFVRADFGPWGAQVEVSEETRNTSAGAMQVDSRSLNLAAWGRYTFGPERRWRPFLGSGLGIYMDRVSYSYGSASTEKYGERYYWGVGAGISRAFWEHLLVELEGRAALVEDRKDAVFSAFLRVGLRI